jgi:hypothetical protein
MKKISFFLIVCTIAVLAACSNEESTSFNSGGDGVKQKNTDVLLNLYTKMIISQSYINEQAALNLFIVKMNFNGNLSDIQGDTEDDMLLWISNNLSTTSFTTYAEAVNAWENVVALGMVTYQENQLFYNEIIANPGHYIDVIPVVDPPVTSKSCPSCKKDFLTCTNAANKAYANGTEVIFDNASNGTLTGTQAVKSLKKADLKLSAALQSCKSAFLACCYKS